MRKSDEKKRKEKENYKKNKRKEKEKEKKKMKRKEKKENKTHRRHVIKLGINFINIERMHHVTSINNLYGYTYIKIVIMRISKRIELK